jgi:hypothetical protein
MTGLPLPAAQVVSFPDDEGSGMLVFIRHTVAQRSISSAGCLCPNLSA